MHGEFKVPGGKLVVVDLDVVDGRIANFRLAGDFFLEPDDALDAINAAVNGLPAETDAAKIARAVRDALPESATLLGFTPESVATTDPPRAAAGDRVQGLRVAAHPRPGVQAGRADGARPGARRGGRRRAPQADPAHLGVG